MAITAAPAEADDTQQLLVDGLIYQIHPAGGIARYFNELLPRAAQLNPDTRISLFATRSPSSGWPHLPGVDQQRTAPSEHRIFSSRLFVRPNATLRKILTAAYTKDSGRSIWHSTYYTMPLRWRGPIVVTLHDLIHERYPQFFDLADRRAVIRAKRASLARADLICCVSETTRQDLVDMYRVDAARTAVVSPAPGSFVLGGPHTQHPRSSFLLYVGDRSGYKNFDFLLHAYRSWPERREHKLVVAGRAWTPRETALLQKFSLGTSVDLVTEPADAVLLQLYSTAAALVHPSLYEGFGIPLVEALTCGCPVVASSIPSTREVAGDLPFYFDPRDAESLHAALDRCLITDQDDALANYRETNPYSWDRTTHQMLSIYRELIQR